MLVKFFVSNECPKCRVVKDLFYTLNLMSKEMAYEMYNFDCVGDKYQFYFYNVLTVPTVIICNYDFKELNRYTGFDEIDKNKESFK